MGIKGIPNLAEELPLQRDIALLEYTNSKLHLTKIASAAALELIKNAKKKKLSLSVGVSINQLLFKDMDQIDFDTNLKFAPIVKTENDRKTLIKALKDGWIDVVCSDHEPLEIECKFLEFDEAKPGAIGLQTIYSNLNKLLESNTDLIINLLSENARKILKLSDYEIDTGIVADLTMFDPSIEWIFESDTNSSLSSNSSQLGATMYGGVLGIINNSKQLFF